MNNNRQFSKTIQIKQPRFGTYLHLLRVVTRLKSYVAKSVELEL